MEMVVPAKATARQAETKVEIARVLVCFNHIANRIVNANLGRG